MIVVIPVIYKISIIGGDDLKTNEKPRIWYSYLHFAIFLAKIIYCEKRRGLKFLNIREIRERYGSNYKVPNIMYQNVGFFLWGRKRCV